VLARTRWYPGWVYAARAGLAPAKITQIADALAALDAANPDHRRILRNAHMTAVIPSTDKDFDTVRALWQQVGAVQPGCISHNPPSPNPSPGGQEE